MVGLRAVEPYIFGLLGYEIKCKLQRGVQFSEFLSGMADEFLGFCLIGGVLRLGEKMNEGGRV